MFLLRWLDYINRLSELEYAVEAKLLHLWLK